jgi:hypothetical protein
LGLRRYIRVLEVELAAKDELEAHRIAYAYAYAYAYES